MSLTPIQFAQNYFIERQLSISDDLLRELLPLAEEGERGQKFSVPLELLVKHKVDARKDVAKRRLLQGFQADIDYKIYTQKGAATSAAIVISDFAYGNPVPQTCGADDVIAVEGNARKETIMLTSDCFKSLCMMSNSANGKVVRNYFLAVEDCFKRFLLASKTPAAATEPPQLQYQQQQVTLMKDIATFVMDKCEPDDKLKWIVQRSMGNLLMQGCSVDAAALNGAVLDNTKPLTLSMTDALRELKIPHKEEDVLALGKAVAKAYRLKYNKDPLKQNWTKADGRTLLINFYTSEDFDLIRTAAAERGLLQGVQAVSRKKISN